MSMGCLFCSSARSLRRGDQIDNSKQVRSSLIWQTLAAVLQYAVFMVGVAEWLRHLVVAQKIVGSNPIAHPILFC